ncbi:MAG: 30S ribosomal protein S9 [Chthoniobacteraceae bacterium]
MSQELMATGRRKTSVASVWMVAGTGQIVVNKRPFEEYFRTVVLQSHAIRPLEVANVMKTFDIKVRTRGGGSSGQAGALRLALARALLEMNPELRVALKAESLLTRDPRKKERKKPGQPGARKRFQFSKR